MRVLLTFLTSIFVVVIAHAHNAPVDELGCHTDPSTGGYHCLTGALSGLEFVSKQEAEEEIARRAAANPAEDSGPVGHGVEVNERLNIVTWRLKKSPAKIDFDRIASILATADIAVVQNLEFNERGETPLLVITNVLEKRLNEKICKGWFKNAKGERGPYGFVWRERVVGFVEKNGEMRESCAGHPWVIHTDSKNFDAKEPGAATFFLKSSRKLFVLSVMTYDKAPKRPEHDLPNLFKGYSETGWAVIFAGDLRTSSKHSAFKDVRKWNFKSALNGPVKSKRGGSDNFWYKNIAMIAASPINLYEQFPELSAKDVESSMGDSFPVRAEFSFSEKEAEAIQTQMITKKKSGKGPASTKAAVVAKVPVYAAPLSPGQLSDLKEDIESEAISIDGAHNKKSKSSKAAKKKKSN